MSNKNTEVIYKEEFNNSLNLQKRLRESWLKSSSSWNDELFQYADPDFYFYRFIINRQERNTSTVLTNILFRLMDQYKIDYIPAKSKSSPFPFTITTNNIKVGYRFSDFFYDDDIEAILQENNVKKAIIIRTLKPEYSTKSISRDNSRYKEDKLPINVINLEDFFNQFFGNNEYNIFLQHLKNYLDKIKNITGYKSIKFLSSMNLSSQKLIEEKFLLEWQYKDYRYQIINPQNLKWPNIYHYLILVSST